MRAERKYRCVRIALLAWVQVGAAALGGTVAVGQGQPARETVRPNVVGLIKTLMASRSAKSSPHLVQADLPAVGCPQDGYMDPKDPPRLPQTVRVVIPEGTQGSLAFYSGAEDIEAGVLAPRGWHCFGTYGSNGSTLYVTPREIAGPILDRAHKAVSGPVVIRSVRFGGTSGRFTVARVSARIFPAARGFVDHVRSEEISRGAVYRFEPWPGDRIARLSERIVSYVTPARRRGLGTDLGAAPAVDPVSGLAVLTGGLNRIDDDPALEGLAVRLGSRNENLSVAIAVAMLAAVAPSAR